MPKPLRSEDPKPKDIQFAHFGVLNAGSQDKTSLFTSITVNIVIAIIVCILGAAAKKTHDDRVKLANLVAPDIKKAEPPKPKVKPPEPKPLPKPPVIKLEPPKIKIAEVKLPDIPKPVVVKMDTPKPVVLPAPPKLVTAPAAPVAIHLDHPAAAAIANNSPHPSAIRMGQMDNPIKNAAGPSVSKINMGQAGAPGMNSANTGLGPVSKVNLGGNGSPNSSSMTGNGSVPVKGVKLGVVGGTGPLNSTGKVAGPVNLGQQLAVAAPKPPPPSGGATTPIKVLAKETPQYTEEAKRLHLEGTVYIKIRVSATGAIQILGVTSGLGHGLDEAAIRVVQNMRIQPAMQDGHPVDWTGTVNVGFHML